MIGQRTIDGRELTGYRVTFKGSIPNQDWPSDVILCGEDKLVVQTTYKVTWVSDGAPVDTRGVPKEPVKRVYETSLDQSSVQVVTVLRAAEAPEEGVA